MMHMNWGLTLFILVPGDKWHK